MTLSAKEKTSPEWLTKSLRGNVIENDVKVTSVQSQIFTGGLMADTLALQLSYSGGTGEEPSSVVAKFPSSNPDSRKSGVELGVYAREIQFYQQVSSLLNMRVPNCYYADYEEANGDFALLLEDLRPAIVPTADMDNCRSITEQALGQLARLHADTWNKSDTLRLTGVPFYAKPPYRDTILHSARQGWRIFKPLAANSTTETQRQVIEKILKTAEQWIAIPNQPVCLIHGDFRFANLMVTEANEIVTLDWQTYMWANPVCDLTRIIGSLHRKQQDLWSEAFKQHYYQQLLKLGVTDYSEEQYTIDYRIAVLCELIMVMWTVHTVGANGLSDQARDQMLAALSVVLSTIEKSDPLTVLAEIAK